MLCLCDHQTMAFKDHSTIPKTTFIEIGVYSTENGGGSENVIYQFVENVNCKRIYLELISFLAQSSLERERKILRRFFMSSIKGEIRHFLRRSRTVTNKRDARAKSLFCFCCCCCCFFFRCFCFSAISFFTFSLLLKLLINRELKQLRLRRRQLQKSIGLMIKTTALHVHYSFQYISLTSTARLRRETS